MARTVFGVHPVLEEALNGVEESLLPADLDAQLPAPRRMSVDELDALVYWCATQVQEKVGRTARPEFERMLGLARRTVTRPAGTPIDYRGLGEAAKRDLEYARGLNKIAAIAAFLPSAYSALEATKLAGTAAALTARALRGDQDALHAFFSGLFAKFR